MANNTRFGIEHAIVWRAGRLRGLFAHANGPVVAEVLVRAKGWLPVAGE